MSYVLIGIVGGNLAGCSDIREYPDYFTYVGHTEVTIKKNLIKNFFDIKPCQNST